MTVEPEVNWRVEICVPVDFDQRRVDSINHAIRDVLRENPNYAIRKIKGQRHFCPVEVHNNAEAARNGN